MCGAGVRAGSRRACSGRGGRLVEASTCIGIVAFWAVHWLKLPNPVVSQIQAPLVVVAGGLVGIAAGAIGMK